MIVNEVRGGTNPISSTKKYIVYIEKATPIKEIIDSILKSEKCKWGNITIKMGILNYDATYYSAGELEIPLKEDIYNYKVSIIDAAVWINYNPDGRVDFILDITEEEADH